MLFLTHITQKYKQKYLIFVRNARNARNALMINFEKNIGGHFVVKLQRNFKYLG